MAFLSVPLPRGGRLLPPLLMTACAAAPQAAAPSGPVATTSPPPSTALPATPAAALPVVTPAPLPAVSPASAPLNAAGPSSLPARRSSAKSSTVAALVRREHFVPVDTDVTVFVTEVSPPTKPQGVVVFTHGAGSPASAVWDLPHGHSIMAQLARRGMACFTVDVRGFGGSTQPPALKNSPEGEPPAVRATDVMADVDAVVELARTKTGRSQVDLVGWSWGSLVGGMYAGLHPDKVRRLILFAPVWDRQNPKRHRTQGAWRVEERALHLKWFNPETEDRRVREAYVDRLFRFTDGDRLILPNGPYRDVYGPDAPVWDASLVRSEVLIIRGNDDKASRRGPASRLFDALENAPRRIYLEIADAGHFAFRTWKSIELQTSIAWFLASSSLERPPKLGAAAAGGGEAH